jgi:hypothetical protein
MECWACGATYREGAKFCPRCGTALASMAETVPCIVCAKPIKPAAKFCPHCGVNQASTLPPKAVRVGAPSPDKPAATLTTSYVAELPKPFVSPQPAVVAAPAESRDIPIGPTTTSNPPIQSAQTVETLPHVAETVACIACAKPIKPSAKFCQHCGENQASRPTATSIPPVKLTLEESPPNPTTAHAAEPQKLPTSLGSVAAPASPVTQDAPVRPIPTGTVATQPGQAGVAAPSDARKSPSTPTTPHTAGTPTPFASPKPVALTAHPIEQAVPVPPTPATIRKAPAQAPQVERAIPPANIHSQAEPHSAKKSNGRHGWIIWLAAGFAAVGLAGGSVWYWVQPSVGQSGRNLAEEIPTLPSATTAKTPAAPRHEAVAPPPMETAGQTVAAEPAEPTIKLKATPRDMRPQEVRRQFAGAATPALPSGSTERVVSARSASSSQHRETPSEAVSSKTGAPRTVASPPEAEELPTSKDPLAKCQKLTGRLERIFCEEKTRFVICQGKWGTTPECPSYNNDEKDSLIKY